MLRHYNIIVTGTVQRVGFRFLTMKRAYELSIKGYVKYHNTSESMYIEAEGEEEEMTLFLKFIRRGPPFSEVKNVEIQEDEIMNYKKFDIVQKNKQKELIHY